MQCPTLAKVLQVQVDPKTSRNRAANRTFLSFLISYFPFVRFPPADAAYVHACECVAAHLSVDKEVPKRSRLITLMNITHLCVESLPPVH